MSEVVMWGKVESKKIPVPSFCLLLRKTYYVSTDLSIGLSKSNKLMKSIFKKMRESQSYMGHVRNRVGWERKGRE